MKYKAGDIIVLKKGVVFKNRMRKIERLFHDQYIVIPSIYILGVGCGIFQNFLISDDSILRKANKAERFIWKMGIKG